MCQHLLNRNISSSIRIKKSRQRNATGSLLPQSDYSATPTVTIALLRSCGPRRHGVKRSNRMAHGLCCAVTLAARPRPALAKKPAGRGHASPKLCAGRDAMENTATGGLVRHVHVDERSCAGTPFAPGADHRGERSAPRANCRSSFGAPPIDWARRRGMANPHAIFATRQQVPEARRETISQPFEPCRPAGFPRARLQRDDGLPGRNKFARTPRLAFRRRDADAQPFA
jgi:hypothetical protein